MTTTTTSTSVPKPRVQAPSASSGGAPRVAPRRSLAIPRPPGKVEVVVEAAVGELARQLRDELRAAERTIADHGFSIEAARLRDRLARSASTDLERLLLATPGVPEALFNRAIQQQLKHEEELEAEAEAAVTDETVKGIDETLEKLHRTSTQLEDSTQRIADVLSEFALLVSPILKAQTDATANVRPADDVPPQPAAAPARRTPARRPAANRKTGAQ